MYSPIWLFTCSFTIFIAGVIALVRFKKINKIYYPFLYCLWIACFNELLSFILWLYHSTSSVNSNFYILFEALLITVLLKNFKILNKPRHLFHAILVSQILVWMFEILYLGKISATLIFFRVFYSFIIVLMSITYLNVLIGSSRKIKVKNSDFLLCLGFILYFTFKALVHSFWLYGSKSSLGFLLKLFTIMIYINVIANLIYALAVLWMPRKIEYTQPY
jgi:hypothetical protein